MHTTGSLWLGDVRPGMRLGMPAFDCSAELVAGYAELLEARHPIHVDAEFARNTRYGRLIAHGPLVVAKVLAQLGGVFGEALQVLLGIGGWRFYGPVFVGDRVVVECTVLDVSASKAASAGAVELEFRVLAADGSLAQRGTASVLVSRASAGRA
ncbi:MAG: MaoC family dehydratase [Burkholderiaceae bacterium]|nr:MaoC family dehydratase [Burkholderiaceae bacterium]